MNAKTLVVVSDTHCGCRVGLCPPQPMRVDGGGQYVPSTFQRKMWAYWRVFWDEWVPEVTRGEPFDLVHNGDAIDGVHHHSTTQISQSIKDQLRIAMAVMEPIVDRVHKNKG